MSNPTPPVDTNEAAGDRYNSLSRAMSVVRPGAWDGHIESAARYLSAHVRRFRELGGCLHPDDRDAIVDWVLVRWSMDRTADAGRSAEYLIDVMTNLPSTRWRVVLSSRDVSGHPELVEKKRRRIWRMIREAENDAATDEHETKPAA